MIVQEHLLPALDQRLKKYLDEFKYCQKNFSGEAVHDLRVAARRLLALVEILRTFAPTPNLKKIRRELKNRLDSMDELRDTQVMLAETSDNIALLPELQGARQWLQRREKRQMRLLAKAIRLEGTSKISRRFHKARAGLSGMTEEHLLAASLLQAVDEAYQTTQQRHSQIDPAQSATIHRTRIAFKKFRYMVEIIHPLLAGFPEARLEAMHKYQSQMGDIQDAEVILATLETYAARHAEQDAPSIFLFYQNRHTELIQTFLKESHNLFTFWRKTPNQPFPWEKTDESLSDAPRPRD